MKNSPKLLVRKGKLPLIVASIASIIITTQSGFAAVGDKMHAFFADEHNTSPTSTTGNRILEIDIENMTLVNSLDVPGNLGHHADNTYNSKIYGVPKGSTYVNVIELRKDQNGTTSMNNTKQINLIHKPRSGDAYNDKFNVVLMVARNRPMGSFINVETDEVVGTIGENVDCRLTDGSMLLSHSDANTAAGAMKYQCVTGSHGGDQVSGHPYWLTPDYAAIVDRSNKQISVYHVQQVGSRLVSTLVNHLATRTSIHQIVPRDRTNLPSDQQSDFYATEEGEHVNGNDYSTGVPHALIHMKLTSNGLELVKRMDLQRNQIFSKTKSDRILNACIGIYRDTFSQALTGPSQTRENRYNALFQQEGVTRSTDQDQYNDFPVDCFYPGIPGAHNADFAPNNKHLYIGMAGGAMSIVDVNRWKIANNIDIGMGTGPGHTCFSEKNNVALSTNHRFSSTFGGASITRSIRYINSERPIGYYWIDVSFPRENIVHNNTAQSHSCYVDDSGDNYYNFFTDGGQFYKIDLTGVFNNPTNGVSDLVVDSLYTGGIPIQGSYIYVKDIKDNTAPAFAANNDTATSNGNAVDIDVLANDTGTSLILEHAAGTSHGQVAIVNGKARYTPNQGYTGMDGFWYAISTPGLSWKWAYVDVTVTSSTVPPKLEAVNDTAVTSPGSSVTIDVLANDSGSNITLGNFGTTWIGTVTKSGNKFVYTAAAGFTGTVDFWYAAVDSLGYEDWAKVVITIGGGQIVNNDTATVRQGQSVTVNVLANDRPGLVLTTVDSAWTGTASRSGNNMVYQAPTGFTGDIEVWYGATDASGEEHWALAVINVTN
ncbi:MAG TPA: hypothetical protein EYH20_06490 [Leucothrix sp.]|nr:hypothetical protein [Leucothrix sp.]